MACCQPVALSAVNVTLPSSDPDASQRRPTCVPALPGPLKNRIPNTAPFRCGRKATPSSIAPLSSAAASSGTAEVSHSVAGVAPLGTVVVNDHDTGWTMAFPDASVAWTEAQYVVPSVRGAAGVKVDVAVAGS